MVKKSEGRRNAVLPPYIITPREKSQKASGAPKKKGVRRDRDELKVGKLSSIKL
jgi:hypothetical protein